ncbi:MAG: hypothetical protein JSU69_06400 [Candidatus Zixiibacteriota bacterium]|nr:MAG: hypothetical protein JSU69_06400 [candidate division Zixibacteria bacterium]
MSDSETIDAPRDTKKHCRIGVVVLFLAIAIHLAMAVWFNFTQDDAFITFRYAANFANGHGLVFNIGERIEGYTNFLWAILMILGRLAGIDTILFSKLIGVACGIGTIIFLYFMTGEIPGFKPLWRGFTCLLLAAAYSFAYWSVAGLETAAFSMMVTASIYFYIRRSCMAAPLLALATLLRPEGALICAILLVYELLSSRALTSYLLAVGVTYIILLVPFLAFKLSYFGNLLPNPFYAKTGLNMAKLKDGLEYVWLYLWHYCGAGLFLVPALVFFKKAPKTIKLGLVTMLVYTGYIILVGGDVLKVHRFFIPVLPLYVMLIVFGTDRLFRNKIIPGIILVGILGWQLFMPFKHVKIYHIAERALVWKMEQAAKRLLDADHSDFSLATSTIGMISYSLTGHTIIDLLGLTDTTVARHPEPAVPGLQTTWKERKFNSAYILSRQPDYILFSTGRKPSAPAERSLLLYSSFLRSYRTIGFSFGGTMFDIFKRYRSIEGNVIRDIDIRFLDLYYQGLDLAARFKFQDAVNAFVNSSAYVPDSIFPYPKYYVADLLQRAGHHEEAYRMFREIVEKDTLVYEVYQSLCFYETGFLKDYDKAISRRNSLKSIMPWYIPELDSILFRSVILDSDKR